MICGKCQNMQKQILKSWKLESEIHLCTFLRFAFVSSGMFDNQLWLSAIGSRYVFVPVNHSRTKFGGRCSTSAYRATLWTARFSAISAVESERESHQSLKRRPQSVTNIKNIYLPLPKSIFIEMISRISSYFKYMYM